MPDKTRQHYVPQFYLREFSGKSGKHVGLFHIPSGRFVREAVIKWQACEKDFYKFPAIEEHLGDIEDKASPVIARIVRRGILPKRGTFEHYMLCLFVVFQSERTPSSASATLELSDKLRDAITPKELTAGADLAGDKMSPAEALISSLRMAEAFHPLIMDLRFKVLRTDIEHPFIASDHPVVLYNQFLEHRTPWLSNTGLMNLGLQIFLPLSPIHLICFFDSEVYKIGGRKIAPAYVDCHDADDVLALNVLQVGNADEQLYFGPSVSESLIEDLVAQARKFRRESKAAVREYPQATMADGSREGLLQSKKVDLRTALKLKCATVLQKAQQMKLANRGAHPRDPFIARVFSDFMSKVKVDKCRVTEFPAFLAAQVKAAMDSQNETAKR